MTASAASQCRRMAVAIGCAAVVGGLPMATVAAVETLEIRLAQVGAPVRLAPAPDRERKPPAPKIDRPVVTAPAVTPTVTDEPLPRPTRGAIEVNTLTELDPDSVGIIDESQGGFGVNLWHGSDRGLIERMLARIPAASASRWVRSLAARLLLSRTTAPRGGTSGKSLLVLRIDRLMAAGEVGSAIKLLRVAPSQDTAEALSRTEVEALFFLNDLPGACQKVRGLVGRHKGLYWQQANAFCLSLSGNHAKSGMIADILRERESDVGPAFFALVDALAGDQEPMVDSLKQPLGLQLAMMRAANMKLPADVLAQAGPAVLRAVARSPNADLDVRLEAAERAMTVGALSAAELAEVYGAVSFQPPQLADPVSTAAEIWGPRGRALLLRHADSREGATATAEALRRGWSLSRERGGGETMVRASLPLLLAIDPAPQLVWFARDAAGALFAAGEIERAMAWYAMARDAAESSDEARAAAAALWPVAALADPQALPEWDPQRLGSWWEQMRSRKAPGSLTLAVRLFTVLESFDRPVGAGLWARVLGDGGTGSAAGGLDPALWHALRGASEAARVGETVLFSLLALGDSGTRGAHPLTVRAVVAALRRVGLEVEARALALEAVTTVGG